jgi:hypothetical protein
MGDTCVVRGRAAAVHPEREAHNPKRSPAAWPTQGGKATARRFAGSANRLGPFRAPIRFADDRHSEPIGLEDLFGKTLDVLERDGTDFFGCACADCPALRDGSLVNQGDPSTLMSKVTASNDGRCSSTWERRPLTQSCLRVPQSD